MGSLRILWLVTLATIPLPFAIRQFKPPANLLLPIR